MTFAGWVDWIERTPDGVVIHFDDEREIYSREGDFCSRSCPARIGDEIGTHNHPGDGMVVEIVEKDGFVGGQTSAWSRSIFSSHSSSQFIVAAGSREECVRLTRENQHRPGYYRFEVELRMFAGETFFVRAPRRVSSGDKLEDERYAIHSVLNETLVALPWVLQLPHRHLIEILRDRGAGLRGTPTASEKCAP